MIGMYLSFGLGFYIGLAMNNPDSYRDATKKEIAIGVVVALLLWPIAVVGIPFIKDRLKR